MFHTTYSEYFTENLHMFDALDFLAELTQHIPPKRLQLIRSYRFTRLRSRVAGKCSAGALRTATVAVIWAKSLAARPFRACGPHGNCPRCWRMRETAPAAWERC